MTETPVINYSYHNIHNLKIIFYTECDRRFISNFKEESNDGKASWLVGGGVKVTIAGVVMDHVHLKWVRAAVDGVLRASVILGAPVEVQLGKGKIRAIKSEVRLRGVF